MCLVRRGREILLARSPHFAPGMYSALAGFVEPGESLEQCLAREVLEETGVRIANPRYFASQPWPFPHSLMIAFVADYAGGEITPAPDEIEDAQWFALDALPKLPNRISIARRLIDGVVAEMRASRFAGVAVQATVREHHSSGATTAPRIPALSIAALTSPSDFASSTNLRAYATPRSRPFGIAIACGSMPGRPSRTREPGN